MWTYFSSFIPAYSIIAAPLFEKLKKNNTSLDWTNECEKAWKEIKDKLASAPIMGFADFSRPLFMHTDACKSGFAAILTQDQNGQKVLVDAISRTTTPTEKNYSSAKLECACIIWAAKKWKHYLYAAPHTVIVTDSYGIQYLQQKGSQSSLVQRWLCEMEGFQYSVRYRKGEENIADYLSRQGDRAAVVTTRSLRKLPKVDYRALSKGVVRLKDLEDDNSASDGKKTSSAPHGIQRPKERRQKTGVPSNEREEKPEVRSNGDHTEFQHTADCGSSRARQGKSGAPGSRVTNRKEEGKGLVSVSLPVMEQDGSEVTSEKEEKKKLVSVSLPEDGCGVSLGDIQDLRKLQAKDSNIQRIWNLANGEDIYQPTKNESEDAEDLCMVDGIIVKEVTHKSGEKRQRIVIPLCVQTRIAEKVHCLSHPGVRGTLAMLQQHYWFRGMKQVVKEVVRKCPECIGRRGRTLTKEVLAPDQRPMVLGGRWHIDGLQLPRSGEYDHLMVATDVATKYVILRPSKGETAEAASGIIMDIVRRFGRPQEITTDRGRAFMSELFMKACKDLFITFKPVGVGQPQADGMVERVNRTLTHVASTMCGGNGSLWANHIGEIEYAMNTRVSTVTKYSPYELVFGRVPPDPVYTRRPGAAGDRTWDVDRVRILRRRIQVLQQLAHENQMEAAKQQASFHNARAQAHTFHPGDKVWLYKPSTAERGVTSKLAYRWSGPYIITRVHGPVTYSIKDRNGVPYPGTVHARHLYKHPEK